MRLLILLIICGLSFGCVAPEEPEEHVTLFGDVSIDFVTDLGIALINEAEDILSADVIDTDYNLVQECVGLYADPYDLTIVHSEAVSQYTSTSAGLLVTQYQSYLLLTPNHWEAPFGLHSTRIKMRHEMIHYVLLKATGDGDVDHSTGFFGACQYQ